MYDIKIFKVRVQVYLYENEVLFKAFLTKWSSLNLLNCFDSYLQIQLQKTNVHVPRFI